MLGPGAVLVPRAKNRETAAAPWCSSTLHTLGPNVKPTNANGEALGGQLLKMCSGGAAKEQSEEQAQARGRFGGSR